MPSEYTWQVIIYHRFELPFGETNSYGIQSRNEGKHLLHQEKAFSGSSIMKYILSSSDKTDATVASTLTTLAAMIILFK